MYTFFGDFFFTFQPIRSASSWLTTFINCWILILNIELAYEILLLIVGSLCISFYSLGLLWTEPSAMGFSFSILRSWAVTRFLIVKQGEQQTMKSRFCNMLHIYLQTLRCIFQGAVKKFIGEKRSNIWPGPVFEAFWFLLSMLSL